MMVATKGQSVKTGAGQRAGIARDAVPADSAAATTQALQAKLAPKEAKAEAKPKRAKKAASKKKGKASEPATLTADNVTRIEAAE